MARKTIRYLVEKPSPAGQPPRYFWQPAPRLVALGWKPERIPANWRELAADPRGLEGAAIAAANAKNAELDAWRTARAQSVEVAPPVPPAHRTLRELSAAYQAAGCPPVSRRKGRPKQLARKTVYEYTKLLVVLEQWGGDKIVRQLRPTHFRKLYETLSEDTPARASALIRVAQALFSWGRREGWRDDNPLDRLGIGGSAFGGRLWPRDAVAAFVATADRMGRPSIGTAVLLNEWLGQREADLLRLPRDLLQGRGLVVRQRKTRAGVALPIAAVPPLVARVEAELARQAERKQAGTHLILSEETGKPYGADNFRHWFAAIRAELAKTTPRFAVDYLAADQDAGDADAFTIGTADLWFMHLRHTAVVRLAETGAELAEIAAVTGHSLATVNQILEHYLIRTGTMAGRAFKKRLDAEGEGL